MPGIEIPTESPHAAYRRGRRDELDRVIKLITLIESDWREGNMRQKVYAAEYLRKEILDTYTAIKKADDHG